MKCRCYPYVLSVLPFKGSLILQYNQAEGLQPPKPGDGGTMHF
jgi:hypothetical protein